MTTAAARRDVRAHQESVTFSDADIVGGLVEVLGLGLVAYLGAVKETRAVAQWASGVRRPSAAVMTRLRTAYQAAALMGGVENAGVVRAWFGGMNPALEDMAPATVLREQDVHQGGPAVIAAARAFAARGGSR